MKKPGDGLLSRREFARRAALLSATASLVPAEVIVPREGIAPAATIPQTPLSLSAAGQIEADSRYQQILSLYGARFEEEQKAELKRMCAELQPMLEKVRDFKLDNGDAPALYLKPLVEREKKPAAAPPPKTKTG
jgi:hypothetical protein